MTDIAPRPERSPQIRPRLREVCRLIVEQGLTLGQAAESAGMAYESARVALHKPHVRQYLTGLKRERLGVETIRSFHRATELRDTAQSEKVQLDAAKLIMTAAGDLAPERDHGPRLVQAIQIIVPEGRSPDPLQVTDKGVIESPAFDPAAWRARAIVQQPVHAQADA